MARDASTEISSHASKGLAVMYALLVWGNVSRKQFLTVRILI